MKHNKANLDELGDPEHYGAGYSVFFQENKLLSYSEIYNWWKMKSTITEMLKDEGFDKEKEYKILDMGCSRGHDIFRINNEFNQHSLKLTGYDIIPQDIAYANKIVEQMGFENISFRVANAENPGFEDNYFDIIICSEVIEHQEKPKPVLKECHRILKPNGVIIITTPNLSYNKMIPKKLRKWLKGKVHNEAGRGQVGNRKRERRENPYEKHVFVIDANGWVKLLSPIGFDVEEMRRGSIVYGGTYFDNHVKLMGFLLLFDKVLDHLTYEYSWNIVIKARKKGK